MLNHIKEGQEQKTPTIDMGRNLCVRCGRAKENERMKQIKAELAGKTFD